MAIIMNQIVIEVLCSCTVYSLLSAETQQPLWLVFIPLVIIDILLILAN